MRVCLFCLYGLLVFQSASGQSSSNIISASADYQGTSVSATWVIGEIFVESFNTAGLEITHGLNAQNFIFLITGDIPDNGTSVYPQPFTTNFSIKSDGIDFTLSEIKILSVDGKEEKFGLWTRSVNEVEIFADQLSSGLYLVTVNSFNTNKFYSFKVIKE